jgi:hypothetical protein
MDPLQPPESSRSLLLRDRGRTGLVQRELAERAGVSRRSVQDWEAGLTLPTDDRLQALIRALLETGGLTVGQEMSKARELWAAVQRERPRMHASFDEPWFTGLLAAHRSSRAAGAVDAEPPSATVRADNSGGANTRAGRPQEAAASATADRAQDWGEAPDSAAFVGRAEELALLQRWVLDERCRVVALLGMGSGMASSQLS